MELRTHTARTTKDIDLTLLSKGTPLARNLKERREQVRTMLQEAAAAPFDDFFEVLVGEAGEDLDGAPEGGSRYPVQARMDGRDFARFHVDVGLGDEVLDPVEVVTGEDWLGFGGVKPPSFPMISAAQQFAEKVHPYTLPRQNRMNTRTKRLGGHGSFDLGAEARSRENGSGDPRNVCKTRNTRSPEGASATTTRMGTRVQRACKRMPS